MSNQAITADTTEGRTLTEQQISAAELVHLGTLPLTAIAKQVGCNRTSLWQWRKWPEFQALLERFSEETTDQAMQLLRANAVKAAQVYVHGLAKAGKSLASAKAILDRVLGDPGKPQLHVVTGQSQQLELARLPDELKRQVLAELGGPADDGVLEGEATEPGK